MKPNDDTPAVVGESGPEIVTLSAEVPVADPAPMRVKAGETVPDVLARIRVVDAESGSLIRKVIEADAEAGTVTRFELDGHGNLVREGDHFQVVEEKRAIRIEWATGRQKASV